VARDAEAAAAGLTLGWRAAAGSSDAQLAAARAALAAPGGEVRAFVRSALERPGSPAEVAGMRVERTLGPFVDASGVERYVDLIPLPTRFELVSAAGVLAVLVVDRFPAVPSPGSKSVELGAGSLWVAARALVAGGSAGFAGLGFAKASVTGSGVVLEPGGVVLLPPGSSLTFELELVHASGAGGAGAVGADAAAMTVVLPAQATITFAPGGARITAVDASRSTVYGTAFQATRNADPPRLEALAGEQLVVPCDSSIASFEVASCESSDFVVAGQAPVTSLGWTVPVATAPPPLLGAAAGAGALALGLGAGLSARFGGLAAPAALARATLLLEPGRLRVEAARGQLGATARLLLWEPSADARSAVVPAPVRRTSDLEVAYDRGGAVSATIVPGHEEIAAACGVDANLDRPLAADGSRVTLAYAEASALFVDDEAAGESVSILGAHPLEGRLGQLLVLENALMGTRRSTQLSFVGAPAEGGWGGTLTLTFPLGGIVPMLPDPYAASFPTPQLIDTGASGSVVATFAWAWGEQPPLVLALVDAPGPTRAGFTLLDLSSHADQFGVAVVAGREPRLAIEELALATDAAEVAVYALPGISWEPVVSDQPPFAPGWQDAYSPDDGPPTLLWTQSVDLVRIEPTIALSHFQRTAAAGKHDVAAQFTLPFGLTARLATNPQTPPQQRPSYGLLRSHYDGGLRDGLQLSLVAGPNSTIPASDRATVPPDPAQLDGPALPGFTTTGSPPVPDPSVYGIQVLGFGPLDAGQFFDQQFTSEGEGGKYPAIPVSRVDVSGYGTSLFSDWHEASIEFVGVARARFEVLVGRTAYELLVLQSVIAPWSIRITRTIIFDRSDGGLVVKHDSGWKAAGQARFELLGPGQAIVGPLVDLAQITNIAVAAGAPVEITGPDSGRPVEFVPVTFDAVADLDPALVAVTAHGAVNVPVAATQVQGYAQVTVGGSATADEVLALMDTLGPAGVSGLLGCAVAVGPLTPGTPQFTLDVSSLGAAATSARAAGKTYAAAVAVALHGTPRLPRDGAWSIGRRASTTTMPTAVDPSTPIPLVRAPAGGGDQWRLLDASDAASVDAPATFYGVLQGVGSAKTLFEHPIVADAGTALDVDPAHVPKLADVGALLGATDVFPDLGVVLSLDTSANPLVLSGDGFAQTYDQDVSQPDRAVFELGIVKLVLAYRSPDGPAHVTLRLDPAASPRWSLDIERISYEVFVSGFGSDPLLTVYGNFHASETEHPGVNGIQVQYGSSLKLVEEIFSGLQPLIAAIGGKVDLQVAFSQNHLTVSDTLAVPRIPLGFGDIHDVTVDLGVDAVIPSDASFHVALGSKEKPFTWLVSPLSGTGAIVLGVAKGELDVYVEAGIGAGLEIDVAIASGGASITLDLAITITGSDIGVTAGLLGQAEVDVLDGLASVSLTLAASITMTPQPALPAFPPHDIDLTAAVAVGIHISICWVVDVDFDGSWQFTQDVPVHV
jgi:hypothetical protein